MGNETIGLDSIWGISSFNKNQTEYIARILQATTATDSGAKKMSGALSGATQAASSGMLGLGGTIGATIAITQTLINGLISAGKSIYSFAEGALMAASRVQQLNYIAQILGDKAGYTAQEVNGMVKAIQEQGISAAVANNLVAQFLRSNLDLAKASALATVAQDSATLANIGSSEALEKLIYGIQTLQPEVLRTAGITISLEQAYKEYAQTLGKTSAELTPMEKKQIALNAVLAEGERIAGAYEASMNTAGKQLGSLKSRLIPDLQAALGGPLQVAFFNVIKGINGIIAGITAMVSEGGILYPVLINLGGALAYLTEPLKAIGDFMASDDFMSSMETWVSSMQDTIQGAINSAYQWGVGLAAQFADGLIAGASSLIQGAINWISNLLKSWFAPHSPPKVASSIDKWGAGTINQWLKGFTKGDFDILDEIQGPLEQAMRAMVNSGDLGEEEAFTKMQEINKKMIEALTGGDTLGEDFFKSIEAAGGEFGASIADLARKQYELQLAEEGVAKSEKELEEARKRSANAGKEVNKLTAEYNQMLRGGASKEALANKLKEINAQKKVQDQAKKDEVSAQGKLDASKENLAVLKEQLALQKKLVDQMLKMAEVLKDTETDKGGGGGGGALPEPPTGGGGGGGDFDPFDPLRDAVEKAKEDIKLKVAAMWESVKALFLKAGKDLLIILDNAVKGLISKWDEIAAKFNLPTFEQLKQYWLMTLTWILEQVKFFVTQVQTWWSENGTKLTELTTLAWNGIMNFIGGYLLLIQAIIIGYIRVAQQMWTDHGAKISEILTSSWETIKTIFTDALDVITNVLDFWIAVFKGDWQTAWDEIVAIFDGTYKIILEAFSLFLDGLQIFWEVFFSDAVEILKTGWKTLKDTTSEKIGEIMDTLEEYRQDFVDWGASLMEGAAEGVIGAMQGMIDAVVGAIKAAIKAAKDILDSNSPSKVFRNMFHDVMKGAELGAKDEKDRPARAVGSAMTEAISAARQQMTSTPITAGNTYNRTLAMSFQNNINNGMSAAQFQAMIVQTVRAELRR